MNLNLVKPDISHKQEILEYYKELENTPDIEKELDGFIFCDLNSCSYKEILNKQQEQIDSKIYMLVMLDNKVIGTACIMLKLEDNKIVEANHLGINIRPSYRKKGYASKVLELILKELEKYNIYRILVSCDINNIASTKIIEKHDGVFEKCEDNQKYYWLDVLKLNNTVCQEISENENRKNK